jgi:chromate reductase
VRILGLCGSLRRQSLNRAALRVAQEVAPEGVAVHAAEIGDLPLYNEDARQAGFPEPVQRLRSEISAADALLFVTPEYNYSVPASSRTPSTGPRARRISPSTASPPPSWA